MDITIKACDLKNGDQIIATKHRDEVDCVTVTRTELSKDKVLIGVWVSTDVGPGIRQFDANEDIVVARNQATVVAQQGEAQYPWLHWASHGIDYHSQAAVASIADAYVKSKQEDPFASDYRSGLQEAAAILIMSYAGFTRRDAKQIIEHQIASLDTQE